MSPSWASGNRKRHVNRLHLGDGHQVRRIGGDHVALFHRDAAGPAVDGRLDGGVAQLDLDVFDGGFVGHDLRAGAFDGGFVGQHGLRESVGAGTHLVGLLARDHALIEQSAITSGLVLCVLLVGDVTRQVGLRLAERCCIARQIGLRLAELRFIGPRVDGEQQVALLHRVAFMERDFGQFAAHLRLHADGGVGFHIADDIDVDRDIPLRHHRDHHRHRAAGPRPRPRPPAFALDIATTGAGSGPEKRRQSGRRQSSFRKARLFGLSVFNGACRSDGSGRRLHTRLIH